MDYKDLAEVAQKACIDIYKNIHVSQHKELSKPVKTAWLVGQALYHTNKRG